MNGLSYEEILKCQGCVCFKAYPKRCSDCFTWLKREINRLERANRLEKELKEGYLAMAKNEVDKKKEPTKESNISYHLYNYYNVTVDVNILKPTGFVKKGEVDFVDFKFSFDFIVNSTEEWTDVMQLAEMMIERKFAGKGYKITKISLNTED